MLVKGAKPYNETVRAIKDLMGPAELGNKIHFVKSRNAELIIRFETSEEMVEELARVPEKLFFLGPDVIKNVVILGRLDRVIILDIDPSTNEEEVLLALRAATPKKLRAMIKVSALWQTTSGHMKALASVPRGVFSARNRLKIGYFLCRLKINAPLPPQMLQVQQFRALWQELRRARTRRHLSQICGEQKTNLYTDGEERCIACERRGSPPIPHIPGSTQCGARKTVGTQAFSRGPGPP